MRRFLALIVLGLVAGVSLTPVAAQAGFGIEPGKVYIDNLFPGAWADVPITVYNQNDYEAIFRVIARKPDYTAESYEALPYLDWVTITPDRLVIAPRDETEVLVVITMPEDADYSGKKSEVWVSFMEQETPGMIKIEICTRLLISTRVETKSRTSVEGDGLVGITAEAAGGEPAPPVPPWAIIGSAAGAAIAGGAIFFLLKKREQYNR